MSQLVNNIKWSFIGQFIFQASTFIFSVLLARLISPQYYGVMGIGYSVSIFAIIIIDYIVSFYCVFHPRISKTYFSTLFWVSSISGGVISLILFFSTDFLCLYFDAPNLSLVLKMYSFIVFIRSIGITHQWYLVKKMKFKQKAFALNISIITSSAIAVIIAYYGYFLEALIINLTLQAILNTLFNWLYCPILPYLKIDKSFLKKAFNYSIPVLGTHLISTIERNIDNLLVGKNLGDSSLGLYNKSYQLITVVLSSFPQVIGQVLFPTLSSVKTNKERATLYLEAISWTVLLIHPLFIIIAYYTEEITLDLFGEKWSEAIPLIRIFSIVGIIQSLGTYAGTIFNSIGKTKIPLIYAPINALVVFFIFMIGTTYYTITETAIAYCIASYLQVFIVMGLICKELLISLKELLSFVIKPILGYSSIFILFINLNLELHYSIISVLMAVLYFSFLYFIKEKNTHLIFNFLKERVL